MKNCFSITDELKENCTESVTNEFFTNNSKWDDEVEDEESQFVEEFQYDEDKNLLELDLYDFDKCLSENFETGSRVKYMLLEVRENGYMGFREEIKLPTPDTKIVVDLFKIDEYGSVESIIVDYDSIFGTRFTSFVQYNSSFFGCDERVMFEGLIIKYKAFDFKPFYWSKNVIFKETGIKKDRATRILKKFKDLGIIKSSEIVKRVINNRPQQITYYDIDGDKVMDLLPQIFEGRDEDCYMEKQIEKYLYPARNKTSYLGNIMQ